MFQCFCTSPQGVLTLCLLKLILLKWLNFYFNKRSGSLCDEICICFYNVEMVWLLHVQSGPSAMN